MMYSDNNSTKFHFFPLQQIKTHIIQGINHSPVDCKIEVTAQTAYIVDQLREKIISFEKPAFFSIQIRKQHILIIQKPHNIIHQVYNLNFNCSFRFLQPKIERKQQRHNLQSEKVQNSPTKLIFSFKNNPNRTVHFSLHVNSQQSVSRFIKKLRKICIEQAELQKRYKAIRKCSSSHRYSLIKSKDILKNNDVIVKGYRKENIENQIWEQCQAIINISKLNEDSIIENIGFFQSVNSVYIIFQTFDYFLQNYSRCLNQKYKDSFLHEYDKKIINVLQIMSTIISTLIVLHKNCFSMSGIFTGINLVFRQNKNKVKTIVNPYFDLLYCKNLQIHQQRLRQKLINFEDEVSSNEILPPQHFTTHQWRNLEQDQYLEYLIKSDIFGLGNVLHELLFNQTVFGKLQNENLYKNNKNGRFVLSNEIPELQIHQPELVKLLYKMIEIQPYHRISLGQLSLKINQLIQIQKSKPRTTYQMIQPLLKMQNQQQNKQKYQADKNNVESVQNKKKQEKQQSENRRLPFKKVKKDND